MTAAETIAAAIEKLERERVSGTPGDWHVVRVGARADIRTDHGYDHRGAAIATAADSEHGALHGADAELIVTLHRTIDAQLAILRLGQRALHPAASAFPMSVHKTTLDLARAILGEAS